MVLHPNETLIRELFAALAVRDVAVPQILLAPTAVFHAPGRHLAAGDYRGCEGVVALWDRFDALSAGSFTLELNDVLVGERHAAAVGVCAARRAGGPREAQVAWLFRLGEGRVLEGWLHPADERAVDALWT